MEKTQRQENFKRILFKKKWGCFDFSKMIMGIFYKIYQNYVIVTLTFSSKIDPKVVATVAVEQMTEAEKFNHTHTQKKTPFSHIVFSSILRISI